MNDRKADFRDSLELTSEGIKISVSPLELVLPGQKVPMTIHVVNPSRTPLHITRWGIEFTGGKPLGPFYVDCDYRLAAAAEGVLPQGVFVTPVGIQGQYDFDVILHVRDNKEARIRELRKPGRSIKIRAPIVPFAKAFLSHSNRNNEIVAELSKLLVNSGILTYVAERVPKPGRKVQEEKIFKKLDRCDFVLALLTPSSLKSKWVKLELEYAKEKDRRIIPILLNGTIPKKKMIKDLYSAQLGEELAEYLDELDRVRLESSDISDIRKCAQELIPALIKEKRQEYEDFAPTESPLEEVIDRILDKGVVVDAWLRVSLVGIEILALEARVVAASVETYLKYAEAIGLTAAPA